ncbi:hypothetical protein ACHAPT_006830 [Fusarium lateritium]
MSSDHWNSKPHGYEPTHVYDVDSESPHPTSGEYKRSRIRGKGWALEVLTLLASLGLLAGIAAIFWLFDDELLEDWKAPLTINTAISTLATLCSAAFMHGVAEFIGQLKWLHFKTGSQELVHLQKFDEASRGPLGSIKFLTVTWNLATLGAFITIASKSFGPLAQQVVQLELRNLSRPDANATFGYAHEYNRKVPPSAWANHWAESIPQDAKMQSAILQGLYGINTIPSFNCPGACSWNESYITIGFKSECKNVTQETLRTETCSEFGRICNMTTPGGLHISTRHADTDMQTNLYMNTTSSGKGASADTSLVPEGFPEIARFAIYRSTSSDNFDALNINITDCTLTLTAYEYSNAKANGSTFYFEKTREVGFGSKSWSLRDRSLLVLNETKDMPEFAMSALDLKALQTFLHSTHIVTEWVDGSFKNTNLGLTAALTGDVDLPGKFDQMALSMTDYLRAGPNSIPARGMKVEAVQYIKIRWVWLIGPVAIEALVVVFAIGTMFINRRSSEVPLWKSSALAVLECFHDKGSSMIRSKIKDLEQIEKMAEKSKVRLE